MRIREIILDPGLSYKKDINEGLYRTRTIGIGASHRISAPDTSTPVSLRHIATPAFVKKAIDNKIKREEKINNATTVKEKFNIVYKYDLKGKYYKVKLRIPANLTTKHYRLSSNDILKFDPVSGELALSPNINAQYKNATILHYNIDDFKFIKRESQGYSSTLFYYIFNTDKEPSSIETIPNPQSNPELLKAKSLRHRID